MTARNEPALTLEAVAEHFAHWRDHKTKRERIPERLWGEAIALLDRYRISQVTRTLRLSGSDLNRRRQQFASARPTVPQITQPDFVEFEATLMTPALAKTTAWAEFQRPDGVSLRIHPAQQGELLALVDRFIGGDACSR